MPPKNSPEDKLTKKEAKKKVKGVFSAQRMKNDILERKRKYKEMLGKLGT